MFLLRSLFVASLAGYWRLFPKRFLMAASWSNGEYSSAFVTCPNADAAKKIARLVYSVIDQQYSMGPSSRPQKT